jgi:5'-nucleotidase (lipoprotein e(P4) family)
VILDADETVLDNSLEAKERAGGPYTPTVWAAWVQRREAGAIPGAREFLDGVRSRGGVVAIVTNRDEALCDDTRENLRALGLAFDVVLCRPDRSQSDKQPRFDAVTQGRAVPDAGALEVLAYVGDNILDFPGASQALRAAPRESLADFGTRFFVLPNPVYGSWEKNADR